MECKKEENMRFCNCSYSSCDKRGICCECIKYHRDMGELPACYFSAEEEKTYNRSIENFIRGYRS
jgi:hypothetical protein